MKPHLQACLAILLVLGVDEAGGGEDVLEGADHAFLQAGSANKAEPGKMTYIWGLENMEETKMFFGSGILDEIKTQLQSEDEIGRGVLWLIYTPGLLTL